MLQKHKHTDIEPYSEVCSHYHKNKHNNNHNNIMYVVRTWILFIGMSQDQFVFNIIMEDKLSLLGHGIYVLINEYICYY